MQYDIASDDSLKFIVKYISDRIAVMYLGNLVELADSDEIYDHTLHPYSKALLSSVPIPDPDKEAQKKAQVLSGDVPSPINPKPGCPFANRCPNATDRCRQETPVLREARPGHFCGLSSGVIPEKFCLITASGRSGGCFILHKGVVSHDCQ